MKKVYKLILGLVAVVAMTTLISCEGPAGPAGADGTATCSECHGTAMNGIENEFFQSGHYAGVYSLERIESSGGWSSSCARCHSSEGFLAYAAGGDAFAVQTPGKWECRTCHGIHETFKGDDFELRMTDPVEWDISDGITVDFGGSSNLCVNCHQTRTAEPNTAAPADSFKISNTHYGPHHGPQANFVNGYGFAELGTGYPTVGSHKHFTDAGCTGCHMGDYADNMGGHTWNPNLATCNACHEVDEEDYDYGGVQTDVAAKLVTLRDKLVALGVVEYIAEDEAYEPVVNTYPMVQAQAYFNWVAVTEDRSLGAHNPKYIVKLLDNTIAALE